MGRQGALWYPIAMTISRRGFLQGSAAGLSVALLPWQMACGGTQTKVYNIFVHGVASGDPLADAVILWTRVSTATAATSVEWQLASDEKFKTIVKSGTAMALPDKDYCVKLDVTGLSAATTYYYRFTALGETSMTGRTRTLPAAGATQVRFGLVSCSSLAHGFFHSYRELSERDDLDAIIHLGDYIYEYGSNEYGMIRPYEPTHEILSLEDYRTRYSQYRRDPNLASLHAAFPMIAIWDDHEFANNSYKDGADNHNTGEGDWATRKQVAARVYREWIPIRDEADPLKIYRTFKMGGLLDLVLLDTRIWGRELQLTDPASPELNSDTRQLLGADQEAWLKEQLSTSTAKWRVVGQQVMMGQLPQFLNTDAWDGYPKARERFLDAMTAGGKNVVVLTGDIHSSWVHDLTPDPMDPSKYNATTGQGSRAVELVVPAVTSPGLSKDLQQIAMDAVALNTWTKFVDVYRRGYVLLDVNAQRVEAQFFHFEDIEVEAPQKSSLSVTATIEDGKNFATTKKPA